MLFCSTTVLQSLKPLTRSLGGSHILGAGRKGTGYVGRVGPLHSAYCTLYTLQCTLYNTHCLHTQTLHTVQCILYTAHWLPHTANYTLHPAHCTLHTAHTTAYCPVHLEHWKLNSALFTLHTGHCTLWKTHYPMSRATMIWHSGTQGGLTHPLHTISQVLTRFVIHCGKNISVSYLARSKLAVQASGSHPSRCNSTNRQNCRNSWINNGILIFFEILDDLNRFKIVIIPNLFFSNNLVLISFQDRPFGG